MTYNLRILVIDDNTVNVEVATGLLELLGCKVDSCLDGLSSIEKAMVNDYDLIMLDLQMPQIDGFEVASMLQDALAPCPMMVAVSANIDSPEVVQKCLNHGMSDVLSKPLNKATLQARFTKWGFKESATA